jgi:phosphoglycerate dehydrogenase-like enzyme
MFADRDLRRLQSRVRLLGPFDSIESAGEQVAGASILLTGWGTPRLTEQALARMPRLQLVAHSAGSVKGMVTEAVFNRNIRVINAAAANAVPVAEFTVSMMVAMLKQIPWIAEAYKRGDREELHRRKALVRELCDISVGLIAASRIGREVIRLLKGYHRLTIKVYDPFLTPEEAQELGVELASLEDACRCTVVSLHAPNIPQTRHMINARTLGLIPDHGLFINTSRGALVDEAALVAELHSRPLYAALDVTDPEPVPADSPLRNAPNLVLTPHIAGAMCQARHRMGELAINQILRFVDGQPLEYEVTREMLPTMA